MRDFIHFPARLKECIRESGCTQVEIARNLGISKHTLTKYLNGRVPETGILYKMARFFKKPMEWFLADEAALAQLEQKQAERYDFTDPEFNFMLDVLSKLLQNQDLNLRIWAIVQFKNAFEKYLPRETAEKSPG